ncbi:MAG: exo-alpha-sialidase [candidate division Zixibacteria bacterium]|nr:exo-alpha-sialidase [candidate division Zixibacteria bacterium]
MLFSCSVPGFPYAPKEKMRVRDFPLILDNVAPVLYAVFEVESPGPFSDGKPQGIQTVTLAKSSVADLIPLLCFGLADSEHGPDGGALLVAWAHDGFIDHFGPTLRPHTPCHFRIEINLCDRYTTLWTRLQGDKDWLLLVEKAVFPYTDAIPDTLRIEQHPGAAGIPELAIFSDADTQGKRLHPQVGHPRTVKPDAGFVFQTMRSLWRRPDRHTTVLRTPERWLGFPDVVHIGQRTLLCVYCDGKGHGGGGGMFLRRSDDLGVTWGDTRPIHPSNVNCPRLQILKDASLLASCDLHDPVGVIHFYRSRDGGHTWNEHRTLDTRAVGGLPAIVASHITQMTDGAWLVVASWSEGKAWEMDHGEQLECYRSTDEGRTWSLHSSLQAFSEYGHSLSEASIVPLEDGRLLLYAREARGDGFPGVKAYSSDQGKTWKILPLPFPVTGRTCARRLSDGRVFLTFRSGVDRAALWAWVGDPEDDTPPAAIGVHANDSRSVGLRDGALHIDNDGSLGQFTRYFFTPPSSAAGSIDLTAEIRVDENQGRAATLSIPFAGKLRFFPDYVVFSNDPEARADTTPGQFHVYRVIRRDGALTVYIDGQQAFVTRLLDDRTYPEAWSPTRPSLYGLSFGNERIPTWADHTGADTRPGIWTPAIPPDATGYSLWRRVEVVVEEPDRPRRAVNWDAKRDGIPDQYLLDHIIEIEASPDGLDQGYSGWVELPDGRIFVVNYTDDAAPRNATPRLGVCWIRGTFVLPSDLPAVR